MRVLAISQVAQLDEVEHQIAGEILGLLTEPCGDGRIVVRRVVESLRGEVTPRLP